jgi:ABC-type sulfate transport system permease component
VAHGHSPAALEAGAIHGYTTAFTFSGIVLAAAAVTAFTLVRRAQPQSEEQPVVVEEEDSEPRVLVTV